MLESMKKGLLAGLGVVAFTRERLEKIIKGLVVTGDLTKEQADRVLGALLEKGDTESRQILEKITGEFERVLSRTPLATKGDLAAIRERLADLERGGAAAPEATPPPGDAS